MANFTRTLVRPRETSVHGTLFLPQGQRPAAGVVLVGGSGGAEPSLLAQSLAAEGIATLSVAYFARPGLPPTLAGISLEYFRTSIRLLIDALPSRDIPVLILGGSRGSEAALLAGVHFGDLVDGVVVTVPGNVVLCGWPPGGPAWLMEGQPLPYVSRFGPDCGNPEAIIAVERIPGPILLISAGADEVWPSGAMARAISARLDSKGHLQGHKLLEYPGAGHSLGYLLPGVPSSPVALHLTDLPETRAARADAWPKTVEFIRSCPPRRQDTIAQYHR